VAGDPDAATTDAVIDAIVAAGVDLIELGVPYGDPLADGPTIAAAGQRALEAGMTLEGSLAIARRAHERHAIPLVFFTYANPILQYGLERFADAAAAAGACGAIIPDIPLEESESLRDVFRSRGLAFPLLVAPSTPVARAARIAAASEGFVYVVSRLGVTGAKREPDVAWIAGRLATLHEQASLPLAVGFGISTAQHVRALAPFADGVVIGSALIDATGGRTSADAAARASAYLAPIVAALTAT